MGSVQQLLRDQISFPMVQVWRNSQEEIARFKKMENACLLYTSMFFVDWKLALLSLASIPISLIAMMTMYSVGMKKMGPYYMAGQKMNNTIIEYINGMEAAVSYTHLFLQITTILQT